MEPLQILFTVVMTGSVVAILWDEITGALQNIPWGFMSFVLGIGSIYMGLKDVPSPEVVQASLLQIAMSDVSGGYNYFLLAGAGFTTIGVYSAYLHYK